MMIAVLGDGLRDGFRITFRMLACCVKPSLRQEYKELYSKKFYRDRDGVPLALFWLLMLAIALSIIIYRVLAWSWSARLLLAIPSGLMLAAIIVLVLAALSKYWLWRIFLTGQEFAASEKKDTEGEHQRARAAQERSERIKAIKAGDCFTSRGTFVLKVYGEVLERNESSVCARCYSDACPTGESGTVRLDAIIEVIPRSEFERRIKRRG